MNGVKAEITSIPGFQASGVHAGLKADNALDFALFTSDRDCVTAGVFTTNTVKAACVLANMARVPSSRIRAVAVNTKHANACTGEQGMRNAERMAKIAAEVVGCDPQQVLVMSTGVIGSQLPMDKIENGVNLASASLGNDWQAAAAAMMTTDTQPKLASVDVTLSSGAAVRVAGVSKGSGMIAPNMATMLGLIFTDAVLATDEAHGILGRANAMTFNRIVVDGDMSTNDMVFLLANGASGQALVTEEDRAAFQEAVDAVAKKLAQDIVRDGEGVTKFVTLHVKGAANDTDAQTIANTIATSPLVKTAFFGGDANWGRIVAAAGRAGVPFDPAHADLIVQHGEDLAIDLSNGAVRLFQGGTPTDYQEADAAAIMQASAVVVQLDCGLGTGEAVVWTCDLSYDYVKINGDYRT